MSFFNDDTTVISAALWIIVGVGLIAWDVYVMTNDVPNDELSNIALFWSQRSLVVAWGLAVLWGHFVVPTAAGVGPHSFPLLMWASYAIIVFGIAWKAEIGAYPVWLRLCVGAAGVAAGRYLFPQSLA